MEAQAGKRNSHSEIEKRRRDKMNQYINDLCMMIPMPTAMKSKPDKLTVLHLTVEHMKRLKGTPEPLTETNHKPSFLSDNDLCNLITQASKGFVVVVGCDGGQIAHITESVQGILNITQADMLNTSFYDFIHADDIVKVKNQLAIVTSNDASVKNVKEISLDSPCPGAKRSFFCRMKRGINVEQSDKMYSVQPNLKERKKKVMDENSYVLVSFDGYLNLARSSVETKHSDKASRRYHLVVIGRPLKVHDERTDYSQPDQVTEFESRHHADGVFTRVDKRFTAVLGYYPDEIIGKSFYRYFHKDDLESIARFHQQTMNNNGVRKEIVYRFRAKAGHYVPLRDTSYVFRNPWSKVVDFLVLKHAVVTPVTPDVLLMFEKRRMDKEIAHMGFNEGSSAVDEGSARTKEMNDLLRRMDDLDSNGGVSRKRVVGSPDVTKGNDVKNSPEHIGTMIAEQAKEFDKATESTSQIARYSSEPHAHQTYPDFVPTSDHTRQIRGVVQPGADVGHLQGIVNKPIYPRTQKEIAHNILIKQLEGIQGAIDGMVESPLEKKLIDTMSGLDDSENVGDVLGDMSWVFM